MAFYKFTGDSNPITSRVATPAVSAGQQETYIATKRKPVNTVNLGDGKPGANYSATPTGQRIASRLRGPSAKVPTWASATARPVGTIVNYNGRQYRAKVAITTGDTTTPAATPAKWELLGV